MESSREIRRICSFCEKEFELTKTQMRQVKEKWAINCSRSCARKKQHAHNHKDKRIDKKCIVCKKEFTVVNWNKDQELCSNKCVGIARFGEKDRTKMIVKLDRILKDEKYKKYIKGTAWRIANKFRLGEGFIEDLIQEYYLKLLEGNNTLIEHVANSLLRKELKKGIVGKWNVDFKISSTDIMPIIKEVSKECTNEEFMHYIADIMRPMNEFERKFILLYIKGFTDLEVMEKIRKHFPIGNEKFYKEKGRIFRNIDHSSCNYGDDEVYTKRKDYK